MLHSVGNPVQIVAGADHLADVAAVRVVEHRSGSGVQEVVEFTLGALNALERAEAFQVGAADVGYQAAGGEGHRHRQGYLARMAGSHLDDCYLVLLAQAQQGEGHSDMVVEVALGAEGAVFRAQHGVDKFLGGGLAVGAGNAYYRYLEMHTVHPGKLLESQQGVGHFDEAAVGIFGGSFHYGVAGALFEGRSGKVVAVEVFTLEGEEDGAGDYAAGVGADLAPAFKIFVVQIFHSLFSACGTESARAAAALVELLHFFPFHVFVARDDHLRNPLAGLDCERIL